MPRYTQLGYIDPVFPNKVCFTVNVVFVHLYQVLKIVSLDCLCLIAPSVFSNVFFTFFKNMLSCFVLNNNGYFFQVLTKFMALLQALCYSRNIKKYSVPITSDVVDSTPLHDEVYSLQHYVINFVSDLRQVGGFLRALRFPPPIRLTATI